MSDVTKKDMPENLHVSSTWDLVLSSTGHSSGHVRFHKEGHTKSPQHFIKKNMPEILHMSITGHSSGNVRFHKEGHIKSPPHFMKKDMLEILHMFGTWDLALSSTGHSSGNV